MLDTIDIGEGRRAADTVHTEGIENATNACALAQLLLIHRKHGIQRMANWQAKPTKTQIIKAVEEDPRISAIAGRAPGWAHKLVPPRVVTFCYYLFSEQDQARADQFFHDFAEGINLLPNEGLRSFGAERPGSIDLKYRNSQIQYASCIHAPRSVSAPGTSLSEQFLCEIVEAAQSR